MVPVRHRLASLVAILGAVIAALGGDARAQVGGPNTWTTVAPLPEGLLWPGVASAAGKLYVFGGLCPPQGTCNQKIESFDPKTNTWAKEPPLPAPRMGMGVATGPHGRIYVLGGVAVPWAQFPNSGGIVGARSVFIYTPKARRWLRGKPMPDGRYAMAAVTGKDGRIYTLGGATNCDPDDRIAGIVRHAQPAGPAAQPAPFGPEVVPGGQCAGTQAVRAFDPRTSRWTALASLPVGCLLPAAAVAPV